VTAILPLFEVQSNGWILTAHYKSSTHQEGLTSPTPSPPEKRGRGGTGCPFQRLRMHWMLLPGKQLSLQNQPPPTHGAEDSISKSKAPVPVALHAHKNEELDSIRENGIGILSDTIPAREQLSAPYRNQSRSLYPTKGGCVVGLWN
jgi:hypothetical protein